MKIFKYLTLSIFFISFYSCENEIDLNADFVETPVVLGLIDHGADTQFIRITKTFLKDGSNAIELASDPNNLYYESVNVALTNLSSGNVYQLKKLDVTKEPGVFSSEDNRVYYTDTSLMVGADYKLDVVLPDGTIAYSETKALENVKLDKPNVSRNQEISFVNNVLNVQDYNFRFEIGEEIAKFESVMFFLYDEEIGSSSIRREVRIPIGSHTNSNLKANDDVQITMTGQRFLETIASEVQPTNTKKVIPASDCIRIEIYAADETFIFYQDLNGPIDGIAQVRPEYSNIENGLGLFASRSTVKYLASIQANTRNELINGSYTLNHGFSNP